MNKFFKMTKAFTLVEVLIVVIIIGLLAGIAVMRIGDTKNLGVITAAANNIKVVTSIRNSLIGYDKDYSAGAAEAENYIRPNSSFQLTLNGTAVTFAYVSPTPNSLLISSGIGATNTKLSEIFSASMVMPSDIFKSLTLVKKANLLRSLGGTDVMEYASEDKYTNIRFSSDYDPDSTTVITYYGVAHNSLPAGTWLIDNP